ncbi:hypothetical protein P4O66_021565 [Electrophorus voltai]|uniref:Cysteine protease n=1 Tax=Electrophorus voltai TaxID=2609070 RepID=A0AAD9E3J1_9TELE|nr:hypothetical protein P4O66_021565 [Electrophorus voltai]
MNSVSPSAAQYVGGVALHDDLTDGRRPPSSSAQLLEPRGHFGHGLLTHCDTEASGEPDEVDRLKLKIMSAWNNVKYGWSVKTKTVFNKTSPLFLMGQPYLLNSADEVECFRLAFGSRLWFTYRKEFPQLEGSSLNSDCGWGCMLRSGQMLLAQGLLLHTLPLDGLLLTSAGNAPFLPGWSWSDCPLLADVDFEVLRPASPSRPAGLSFPSLSSSWGPTALHRRSEGPRRTQTAHDLQSEALHRQLVSWFGDQPAAPFGVHRLVELGRESGKRAGDWYGPSLVAHILCKAVNRSTEVDNLAVYVAQDCTVYKEDVMRLCDQSLLDSGSSEWRSVIILVPVRLGGECLNPAYTECVKKILRLQCCIGIIGGKPKHSLFFIGFQDEQLLYLDPHYCQPVVDVTRRNFSLEALSSTEERYPIFTFVEGRGQDCSVGNQSAGNADPFTHIVSPGKLGQNSKKGSTEEFVFL